jgi:HlyD family secretion protein
VAQKPDILTIPIQALVQRDPAMEKEYAKHDGKLPTGAVAAAETGTKPQPEQGVYVLSTVGGKLRVRFVPVTTGISGATDTEVLSGLKQGDEIVTGRYQVLRNLKSGTIVKRDNTPVTTTESS